ncbi:acyltransferase [Bacillus sp. N1-1]|uniref:acyltransferase family protein n=1 Tax=Bacillus sp. N1-1 TaxID=2682541 RepID=UPI001316FEFE|nr:acyltransferase [Bacillus sp. N1-1]QHA93694.1 acyltransferase family protein [Bacillus sp. N1-1]
MRSGKEYLIDRMEGRKNHFDLIRFIAASLVVVTHAYATSLGNEKSEPFILLSNGQSTLGYGAVLIFFITSGFLITMSYDRSRSPVYFLKARVLRIFPALIVIVVLTVFIMGPLLTTLTLPEYFRHMGTYEYLRAMFLWPMPFELPGVFATNAYEGIVNGSLWTLAYEFLFYFVVLLFGITRLLDKKFIVLGIFIFMLTLTLFSFPIATQTIELFSAFSGGMVFYLYRRVIPYKHWIAVLSLLALGLTLYYGGFIVAFAIFGSYLTFYLAYSRKIDLSGFGKHGDFSYGIYIYGFPIQQILTEQFGGKMDVFLNFFIAYPLILFCAFLSWHFIEKKALTWKKYQMRFSKKNERWLVNFIESKS